MIFLFVGFLERALNKGRGPEGYIITATCIPKDIYESCSTSSWWSCWLVLPETSKNKKVILLCLWSYFINQLMECKTNDPNFTSLNEEGTLSANKMKSLSFFYSNCNIFLTLKCSLHSITYRCPIHIPSHNLVTKKVSYQGLLKTH